MERLWAPWRIEYIKAPKEEDCIFCEKSTSSNDRENLVLYRGKHAFVLMNLYPYNNGHIMIAPYDHKESISALDKETRNEIMELANSSMQILGKAMNAEGFNMGANFGKAAGAGIEEHLHFHLVPRWIGDTNFMPVAGHSKVMVEGLMETYDNLKLGFAKI